MDLGGADLTPEAMDTIVPSSLSRILRTLEALTSAVGDQIRRAG
jgi:hypothetical protein